MRFTRIMTMLVAVFTAALIGLTTASTAEAATKTSPVSTQAVAAKPYHTVKYLDAGKVPGTRSTFYVKGRLTSAPGYRVYLQQRTAAHPTYRTVKSTVSASDTGRFVIKFTGPCGAGYQIVIRETYSFARTAIRLGRIYCS
ncbi:MULTISPECIES: hypothetical protein [unclassified Nocardioides]|uniref:hypothetical protein n=1 Tax=unclassified Nocardioides TaxID=2615069 RepID=UPI0006F424A5|nr:MULTISPECIES: hypothetical protein [unclassified Nocardioides]KRA30841.1 hypothetical protein ASD81_15105 [Nocardioides sp. Root614]KRA87461.1 hypothetical protein ASD84_15375 [Nocardioides sp. Root682]